MYKLKAIVAVLLLSAGITLAVASPAQAAGWIGPCHGAGVVCLAEHINGGGSHWGPTTLPYGRCIGVPSWLNDKTSSLWNKYGIDGTPPLQLSLYRHNPCGDRMYTWGPGAYVLNIGRANNDIASAVCLGPIGTGEGYCPVANN
jgi:hypothetical protein